MAKDDDLYSWNRPVPRSSVAGDNLGQAAKIIQTRLQSSDSFRTDTRIVGDASVRVHTNQGMPWVEATAPTSKPVFKSCPRSDWGFIDTTNSQESSAFLGEDPVMGSGPINKLIDAEGNRKQAKLLKNSSDQKSLIYTMLPSLYTGAMRWAVQVTQGAGTEMMTKARMAQYDAILGELVPLVHPYWSSTHGVFIGTKSSGAVTRWIVEIGISGVWRIPVNFCAKLPENWEASQSSTLLAPAETWGEAHKALSKYWTVTEIGWGAAVKIAEASEIPMYAGHGGLYSHCGWAFDKYGNNAVNVGVRSDPADGTGRRKIAALFKITIVQDADGSPIGVSCEELEADYLMNPVRDDWTGGDKAILQVATSAPGVCSTYSCWPGFSNFGSVLTTNTPVFAYYDSTDTMQVVRYNYKAPSASETITTGNGGALSLTGKAIVYSGHIEAFSFWSTTRAAARIDSVPSPWSTAVRGYGLGGTATPNFTTLAMGYGMESYSASRIDGYYAEDGPSGYANYNNFSVSWFGYVAGWDPCGEHNHIGRANWYNVGGDETYSWPVRCQATGFTRNTVNSTETNTVYEVIILHGYDRTSYVHFHYNGNAKRNKTRQRIGAPFVRGTSNPEIDESKAGTAWAPISDHGVYTAPESWGACGGGYLSTQHYQCGVAYNETIGELIAAHDLGSIGFGPSPAETYYDPDEYTDNVDMRVVIDNQVFTLDGNQFLTDGNAVSDLYLDGATFNYTACSSGFVPTRVAYDTYINATSVAAGFNYTACTGRLHAFAGVF